LRRGFDLKALGVGIVSLDADYREDDDCCRLSGATAEAHNATLVRKFDYRAHQPRSPSPAEAWCSDARSGVELIKRYARLTVR
jgi:hypothetical protein